MRREDIQDGFSILTAPTPPRDQTLFALSGNKKELLIGVAALNSVAALDGSEDESLEIFFNPRNDEYGWFQFYFPVNGEASSSEYLPYPEAHASDYPRVRLARYEWRHDPIFNEYHAGQCNWLFAWFAVEEVFRYGPKCGFNICRTRPAIEEYSSWSFCSGNGFGDATSFGTLYRDSSATRNKSNLRAPQTLAPEKQRRRRRDFRLGITYDIPDNLMMRSYTPQSLREEFAVFEEWGIKRINWIDYSDAPPFWRLLHWSRNYKSTTKHCGDLLPCAVEQAHALNLEIFADFKVFDLGINTFFTDDDGNSVPDIEGRNVVTVPEIAAHPEWTMQSHPTWQRSAQYPITTLRVYSKTPLPEIDSSLLQLRVSQDNREYKKYAGPLKVSQGTVMRPHQRWTPAGTLAGKGRERNWFIEISGLRLTAPFAALQIKGEKISAMHHGFMLMEAVCQDGSKSPLTIATHGQRDFRDSGYFFWKEWPGWNNYSEPIIREGVWQLNDLGFTFQQHPNLPTLLEPGYEGTRNIWLNRIQRILDTGVDGVCIRILNHHNGVMSWLQYAFAPVVVQEFQSRFGRAPQPDSDDYEQIRRIRGEYFTEFLRSAKLLTKQHGKKLIAQFEYGMEVPPHLDTRMQIFWDYRTWINEGIMDEIYLKFWTAYSPFIHCEVLPLAANRQIPVHIVSRNSAALDMRSMETIPRLVTDAQYLGFSGFNFYEAADILQPTAEGALMPRGAIDAAIKKSLDCL